MKVSSVSNRRKQLTAVTLEDGSQLMLDTELTVIKGIAPGVIIDDPDTLLYESELKRAKSRAMWYLSRGDHSENGLYDKLIAAGFPDDVCNEATERMKELGLINDEAYARRLAEYLSASGASDRDIYIKLIHKGIDSDMAKFTIEDLPDDDEVEKILNLLKTKFAGKLENWNDLQKTIAALQRKGFTYADVRAALRRYNEEIEDEEEE
ncbi:MAG: RecX family transcriptional regulator [Clostridia bacterium]|jgi:regulatory protein|nr:RecX family transcriptional regulator [Clostridia bacterium]